jgi:hypothetical protein
MKLGPVPSRKALGERFVSSIYATHNRSPQIRLALDQCLNLLRPGARGLVVGAGSTNLHPALINLTWYLDQMFMCVLRRNTFPFPTRYSTW